MKYGALLFFILFTGFAHAVYGPHVVPASEPFVVSLHLSDKENPRYDYFCSGVLISPTKVLTAGHCIDVMGQEVYDYSHGLIYRPSLVVVRVGGSKIAAKEISYSSTYFQGTGSTSVDLALIELEKPVRNVAPIKFASEYSLLTLPSVTIIARSKKVEGKIIRVKRTAESTTLQLEKSSGACLGDSGGAIVVKQNGEPKLAGILMYDGEGSCDKKSGQGFYPRAQF